MFDDEYHGMGGSYIEDPKTGKRRPETEADSEPDAAEVEDESANATSKRTVKKPKGGE